MNSHNFGGMAGELVERRLFAMRRGETIGEAVRRHRRERAMGQLAMMRDYNTSTAGHGVSRGAAA